ncbi:ELM1/GtrOC1 family putative glycosyltransferase [Marinobacter sp.]|uniref:ELM1/GtrOC1 family putative glycosyltransferase n=1 Tax=Marinobacter sp. TaxID=50741 RepID=UPI003850080B
MTRAQGEGKEAAGKTPVVWLLTDHKPGHRNQLKGLGNRLRVLAGASLHWIDVRDTRVPAWRALVGASPSLDLPRPDLIVAAGAATHRLLLALRRKRGANTLVLMKPSFPLWLVDGAIIPEHDGVKPGRRVFVTEGVINTMTPMAKLTSKPEALALIGGPSKHYKWDGDLVLDQLLQLMQEYPEWRWTLSGSRRTPPAVQKRLEELAGPRVTVADPERTHEDWLAHALAGCRAAWVTPDSGSMVYEALTAGLPVGIFGLQPQPSSRIARSVEDLVARDRLARWQDHHAIMSLQRETPIPLWEADRAARWTIRNLLKGEGH